MVLFLAANTSFYDFPLLSAIMARDKYMPRQFTFRGDRLAYSHGIGGTRAGYSSDTTRTAFVGEPDRDDCRDGPA